MATLDLILSALIVMKFEYTFTTSFDYLYMLLLSYLFLRQITGVGEVFEPHEVLLDTASADEPVENADASSLVICPTRPCATERLLPDDGSRALLIVVYVACCIAQLVRGADKRRPRSGEAG